jgi:hypothetical protein
MVCQGAPGMDHEPWVKHAQGLKLNVQREDTITASCAVFADMDGM